MDINKIMKFIIKLFLLLTIESLVYALVRFFYKNSPNGNIDFAWEASFLIINLILAFILYKKTKSILALLLILNSFLSIWIVNKINKVYTTFNERNRYLNLYFKEGRDDFTLTLDYDLKQFSLQEEYKESNNDIGISVTVGTFYSKKDTIIIQFDSLKSGKIYDSLFVNFFNIKDTLRVSKVRK